MDNQPRSHAPDFNEWFSHGHLTWADTTLQQLLSARRIVAIAKVLGRSAEIPDFAIEIDRLTKSIKALLWDAKTAFYYDADRDGAHLGVKSIGAYWALLAECVDKGDLSAFVAHLENPEEFFTQHPLPTLSKDHPAYEKTGGYWLGAVWAPTNYMVITGLALHGCISLAQQIAARHLDAVVAVCEDTGTLWENYAPENNAPGNPAQKDFVGWTGLVPIAVLFEHVFGLQPKAHENRIVWHCGLTDEFGVDKYPFGTDGILDIAVKKRGSAAERPQISVTSNLAVTFEIHWGRNVDTWDVLPGTVQQWGI
jgi:glycogen debranching enzyme